MSQRNLKVSQKALVQACKNLKIPYQILHKNGIIVKVELNPPLFFLHHYKAFNREDIVRISNDKDLQYTLLNKHLQIPPWKSYLDPHCNPKYQDIARFNSIKAISQEIRKHFNFPVIVKRNKGSQGNNVFICKNIREIRTALRTIYDKKSRNYDYIAIAQKYVSIKSEFRVIGYKGDLLLNYMKDNKNAEFQGNISPLHWKGASAKLITDEILNQKIEKFIKPIFDALPIKFTGLDIAQDDSGNFWLIEINNSPGLAYFAKDNGIEHIVKMYEFILSDLRKEQGNYEERPSCKSSTAQKSQEASQS